MNLLDEILLYIFTYVECYDLISLSRTCHQFDKLISDNIGYFSDYYPKDVYHLYYLYSLKNLTKHTPLDKRDFALLARKACKGNRFTTNDLDYYFEKLRHQMEKEMIQITVLDNDPSTLQSTTTGMIFTELRMRLGLEAPITPLWSISYDPAESNARKLMCKISGGEYTLYRSIKNGTFNFSSSIDLFTLSEVREISVVTNSHNYLYQILQTSNSDVEILSYKSDAITTAMVLAKYQLNSYHATAVLINKILQLVWVDNSESFLVMIKYMYPRLNFLHLVAALNHISVYIAFRDAIDCYLVYREFCRDKSFFIQSTIRIVDVNAHLCNSLGIVRYATHIPSIIDRVSYFLIKDKYKIANPFY